VSQILQEKLPKKLKVAVKSLYPNYNAYLSDFLKKGGVIEAIPICNENQITSPSIFFEIDPQCNIKVLGSYDKISG